MSKRSTTTVTFSLKLTLPTGMSIMAAQHMIESVLKRAGGKLPDDPTENLGLEFTINLLKKETNYGSSLN